MVRSFDELEEEWQKLQTDLLRAYHHFQLFRWIDQASVYRGGVTRFYDFWNLTQAANRDAALHGLYKFYDKDARTLTLLSFLESVTTATPAIAAMGLRPPDAEQLQRDKQAADQDANPRVATLIKYRHQYFAHRNRKLALDGGKWAEGERLHYADVETTFKEAIEILERLGYLFGVDVLTRSVMSYDDVLEVLDATRDRNR